MAAARIRPPQWESCLRCRAPLQQRPPFGIEEQHGKRPVQESGRLMGFLHCRGADRRTVFADQLHQVRLATHPRSPLTLCAASFPEISTIGTPTPGCVPEPTKTTLDSSGWRLLGRNGPVWPKV